jgi:hypothetical protein
MGGGVHRVDHVLRRRRRAIRPASERLGQVYGYSCCGGGFGTTPYRPRPVIKVEWIRDSIKESAGPATTIVLEMTATGPLPTVRALKEASTTSHPSCGRTNLGENHAPHNEPYVRRRLNLLADQPGKVSHV